MKFYLFRQNNSGGYFTGPAKNVLVQANSLDQANDIAPRAGIYFDGCDRDLDCDCCGDRWYRVDDDYFALNTDGNIPDRLPIDSNDSYSYVVIDGKHIIIYGNIDVPDLAVFYADGQLVFYKPDGDYLVAYDRQKVN